MQTIKNNIQITLAAGLLFISLGGWLLHLRIHPPGVQVANWIPFAAGLLSAFAVPCMFMFRRTLHWAYILNGMMVILGMITMAHFSIAHWQGAFTMSGLFLKTLLPDIVMLGAKFALGKALFELSFLKQETDPMRQGHSWRYPNMGWWWVHLAAMSAVYALGHWLWP
ncbi:hypothetical protein JW933_08500 [candidate division FCPU426 bacterium]|nr:hypothetical protein [candidate division FCPU426 bacterium]